MSHFSSPPNTLSLPRIMCLHGGGVSAEIFFFQSRSLISALAPYFRLVFTDAPFFSDMHPDLVPVYGGMGPTYRWSAWLKEHSRTDSETACDEIEDSITRAMKADDEAGGDGDWVGLLGFSQGANISASILFENQERHVAAEASGKPFSGFADADWKFGVLLAGSAPPKSLGAETTTKSKYFCPAGEPADTTIDTSGNTLKLRAPTVHVHGLRDPGLELHKELFYNYCVEENTTLIEWDEGHRVPFKPVDVNKVVSAMLKISRKVGVK